MNAFWAETGQDWRSSSMGSRREKRERGSWTCISARVNIIIIIAGLTTTKLVKDGGHKTRKSTSCVERNFIRMMMSMYTLNSCCFNTRWVSLIHFPSVFPFIIIVSSPGFVASLSFLSWWWSSSSRKIFCLPLFLSSLFSLRPTCHHEDTGKNTWKNTGKEGSEARRRRWGADDDESLRRHLMEDPRALMHEKYRFSCSFCRHLATFFLFPLVYPRDIFPILKLHSHSCRVCSVRNKMLMREMCVCFCGKTSLNAIMMIAYFHAKGSRFSWSWERCIGVEREKRKVLEYFLRAIS